DAISAFVRPGNSIHFAYGGARPNAAVAEIVRQFTGTDPGFTVSAHGFVNSQHAMVQAGLIRKLITPYAGENYPAPRPNGVLQRAIRSGEVDIECWSIWTLTARLMAGALGIPFMPVKSLVGSSMADTHLGRDFAMIDSGFEGAEPIGAVSAYRPDVVLVHGI